MSKIILIISGIAIALCTYFLITRDKVGSLNGAEFWGDKYADVLANGKLAGTGNAAKFYSDVYIREKFNH